MDSAISDPETFDVMLRFKSALENGDDLSEFGQIMNISPTLMTELSTNSSVRIGIIDHLDNRIADWMRKNSNVDLTPAQEESFLTNLKLGMFKGKLDIETQILLAIPKYLDLAAERFDLVPTRSRRVFVMRWHKKYYSQHCTQFEKPGSCMVKAARYGDMKNFAILHKHHRITGRDIDSAIQEAASNGHREIYRILYQDPRLTAVGVRNAFYGLIYQGGTSGEALVKAAARHPLLTSEAVNTGFLLSARLCRKDIFRTLYADPRISANSLDESLIMMARGGCWELIELLLSGETRMPERSIPSQNAIKRALMVAARLRNGHLLDFMLSRADITEELRDEVLRFAAGNRRIV